jgi:hypothetical protein
MLTALVLFLAIGFLPIFVYEFRNDGRLMLMYWFVIALHQIVAFTNVFLFGTLGATGDGLQYHIRATLLPIVTGLDIFTSNSGPYQNILGITYWLFGPSMLLGEQLSILAFALSIIVLIKMLRLMNLSQYRMSILLFFGALPTMVLFGSVTLRESFEILFFMLAVYFGMKMHFTKNVKRYCVYMVLSALLMGSLHRALIFFAVFLIGLFVLTDHYRSSNWLSIKKSNLIIVSAIVVFLVSANLAGETNYYLFGKNTYVTPKGVRISCQGLLCHITRHRNEFIIREPLVAARTRYVVNTDFSSPFATVRTFIMMYVHYLFTPFPWQIKNSMDLYASMESILRMVLIYFSVKHWYNAAGIQRSMLALILILFFSMSFLWSIGTSSYGTAIRHHLITWWLISIGGVPFFMRSLSRLLR